MLEFVYLIGIFVYVGIFGYWCQTYIQDKRVMFITAILGGMLTGGAMQAVVRESNNDTSTTIGFWMEIAKIQMIAAEKNPPALLYQQNGYMNSGEPE
jgi:uncharacterized membrane protein YiaA